MQQQAHFIFRKMWLVLLLWVVSHGTLQIKQLIVTPSLLVYIIIRCPDLALGIHYCFNPKVFYPSNVWL